MAYLGKTPSQAVRSRYYFTASGGETSLSGTDDNGNTLTYTDGNYVDVSLNGVALVAGSDYNTTTANTIGGLTALTASDVVEVVVYDTFSVFSGNVNSDFSVGGDLTITGTTTTSGNINFGDNDKAVFGAGSDLQIYHDGNNSLINDLGTGDLRLRSNGSGVIVEMANGNDLAQFLNGSGEAKLMHNGSEKLSTTSTGIDVTGTVTADDLKVDGTDDDVQFNDTSLTKANLVKYIGFHGSDGRAGYLGYSGASGSGSFQVYNQNNSAMTFHNNSSEAMRIDSSGKVAIGTTSTAAGQLTIQSSGNQQLVVTDDGSEKFSMKVSGNDMTLEAGSAGSNSTNLIFKTSSSGTESEAMRINSSGNIGIGTTSPTLDASLAGLSVNASGRVVSVYDTEGATLKLGDPSFGANRGLGITLQGTSAAISNCESGELRFGTGNTERMRITSGGNVGIGTTNALAKLHVSNTNSAFYMGYGGNEDIYLQTTNGNVLFTNLGATTERMRIDSSGNLLLNTTSQIGAAKYSLKFDRVPNTGMTIENTNGTSLTEHILFRNPNGGVGSITTSGSSTAFNTSSDHRLKENVTDMAGAIDRVKVLAPKRFNFIADADTTVDGFLAHEAQAVVPEAVTGTHNEVDEDGNPVMQGIDQSKLVPLLTGALQEAIAKIEALETSNADLIARIETLENA